MLNHTFQAQTMISGDLLQFTLVDAKTESQLALYNDLAK